MIFQSSFQALTFCDSIAWWMLIFRPSCAAQYFKALWKSVLIFQHSVVDLYKFSPWDTSSGPTNVPVWLGWCLVATDVTFLCVSNTSFFFSRWVAWHKSHRMQPDVSSDWWGVWVEPALLWKCFCKAWTGMWEWRSDTENLSAFVHCSGEASGIGYRIN